MHPSRAQPLTLEAGSLEGEIQTHEKKAKQGAPSSPCCISSIFPSEASVPELHLNGEAIVICSSNATRGVADVRSHWNLCPIIVPAFGVAFLLSDCTSGSLAVDFLVVDVMCMVFIMALLVGTGLNLYTAFQINSERCAQARAEWVRRNTTTSPAVIAERRRLLVGMPR